MTKQFECCFERKGKGIYLEVEEGSQNVEFTSYYDFNPAVSVCLRKEEVEELIEYLQETIKKF